MCFVSKKQTQRIGSPRRNGWMPGPWCRIYFQPCLSCVCFTMAIDKLASYSRGVLVFLTYHVVLYQPPLLHNIPLWRLINYCPLWHRCRKCSPKVFRYLRQRIVVNMAYFRPSFQAHHRLFCSWVASCARDELCSSFCVEWGPSSEWVGGGATHVLLCCAFSPMILHSLVFFKS